MSNRQSVTVHFPLLSILFVVFVVLKLCGTIDWSWWWVTMPMWGPMALFLAVAGLVAIGCAFTPQVRRR